MKKTKTETKKLQKKLKKTLARLRHGKLQSDLSNGHHPHL